MTQNRNLSILAALMITGLTYAAPARAEQSAPARQAPKAQTATEQITPPQVCDAMRKVFVVNERTGKRRAATAAELELLRAKTKNHRHSAHYEQKVYRNDTIGFVLRRANERGHFAQAPEADKH